MFFLKKRNFFLYIIFFLILNVGIDNNAMFTRSFIKKTTCKKGKDFIFPITLYVLSIISLFELNKKITVENKKIIIKNIKDQEDLHKIYSLIKQKIFYKKDITFWQKCNFLLHNKLFIWRYFRSKKNISFDDFFTQEAKDEILDLTRQFFYNCKDKFIDDHSQEIIVGLGFAVIISYLFLSRYGPYRAALLSVPTVTLPVTVPTNMLFSYVLKKENCETISKKSLEFYCNNEQEILYVMRKFIYFFVNVIAERTKKDISIIDKGLNIEYSNQKTSFTSKKIILYITQLEKSDLFKKYINDVLDVLEKNMKQSENLLVEKASCFLTKKVED